jgi:hypothetical protein
MHKTLYLFWGQCKHRKSWDYLAVAVFMKVTDVEVAVVEAKKELVIWVAERSQYAN